MPHTSVVPPPSRPADFISVTEVAGDDVTQEQIGRICHRYYWAAPFCAGKDVFEIACGTGQGLGILAGKARNFLAGDLTREALALAQRHYGSRISLMQFDAQRLPVKSASLDVIVLFETIYYLSDARLFIKECRRVLRDKGKILIATANKDLFDFNPSPYSTCYYGVVELKDLFQKEGFAVECFGHTSIRDVSWIQRILRPVKKMMVRFGLMPKTMQGKKFFKQVVFGKLKPMPAEIREGMAPFEEPVRLSPDNPDRQYKVIYCIATQEG